MIISSIKNQELNQVIAQLHVSQEKLAQQAQELKALSLRDGLTGLYNRRGFFTLAEQQLKRVARKKMSMLIYFIDIDGLKEINDRFGHKEGDGAISKTADLLRDTFREEDIIARIGGDEFAVLTLEAEEEHQEVIIARLQDYLHTYNTSHGHPKYVLSLSIGVASCHPESVSPIEKLLGRADEAMYKIKQEK